MCAVVIGGGLCAAIGDSAADATTAPEAFVMSSYNVLDLPTRSVLEGWGRAELGGTYRVESAERSRFDTARGVARIFPGRGIAVASLTSSRSADERLRMTFSIEGGTARLAAPQELGIQLRRQASGAAYEARIRVDSRRRLSLQLVRASRNEQVSIGRSVSIAGRAVSGRRFVVQMMVTGAGVPTLRARAWQAGRSEPGWQVRATDSSSQRIRDAGLVAVWRLAASDAPTTFAMYRLVGNRMVLRPISRTPSSGSPTSGSPTSGSPTSGSPTSGSSSSDDVAGSVPVGSASYPVPSGAMFVDSADGSNGNSGSIGSPLKTVSAAVQRMTNGVIVLRAGTYHESIYIPSNKNITIQAYPGEAVWFDGSVPVTNWVRHGSVWVASGWTANFDHSASFTKGSDAGGFVNPSYPMSAYPDEVFFGSTQLAQVSSSTVPAAGQFAVDTSAQTLTVGSDPTNQTVDASTLSQAFVVSGRLTLQGVGVRRYATSLPQMGTIYLGGSTGGSSLNNDVVTDNATQGVSLDSPDSTVDHVTSDDNGMTGIHANKAPGSTIENSVASGNNTQHFNPAPSAAGIKVTGSNGFTIAHNVVQNNLGVNGIWLDCTMSNFVITGNLVSGNSGRYGIITELSASGIVADNTESGAQFGYTAFDTGNVEVYNNSFSNNSVWDVGLSQDSRRNNDPSTQAAVPWVVHNVVVANNVFGSAGAFQFYALDKQTGIAASSMAITINGNAFPSSSDGGPTMVGWGGSDNSTVTRYRSPSALDAGLGVSWNNAAPSLGSSSAVNMSSQSYAVPLPADVAASVGQPTGTQHVGTF